MVAERTNEFDGKSEKTDEKFSEQFSQKFVVQSR